MVCHQALDPAPGFAPEEAGNVLVAHALQPPETQSDSEDGEPLLLGQPVEDILWVHVPSPPGVVADRDSSPPDEEVRAPPGTMEA